MTGVGVDTGEHPTATGGSARAQASTPSPTTCVGCGKPLVKDHTASDWLHRGIWYDPDVVDVDEPGTWCEALDDEHQPGPKPGPCPGSGKYAYGDHFRDKNHGYTVRCPRCGTWRTATLNLIVEDH